MHPRALLIDLDDTILDDSSLVHECWHAACASHADRLAPFDTATVVDVIRKTSQWYWDDPDRHRTGRLELDATRRHVVRLSLDELGIDDVQLADSIGTAYAERRDTGIEPFPDAIDTVHRLRRSGRRLALLTNGAGGSQRRKIDRFGLADLFDAILIEGELGFGKPDTRVYQRALTALGVRASEAWMIGDNLEWDVTTPQLLGITGVWIDARGHGVPEGTDAKPDHIVQSLSDVLKLIPSTFSGDSGSIGRTRSDT
jgi:putative hydrolase of the HAD superfamily